jgi:hypothetical protein
MTILSREMVAMTQVVQEIGKEAGYWYDRIFLCSLVT